MFALIVFFNITHPSHLEKKTINDVTAKTQEKK